MNLQQFIEDTDREFDEKWHLHHLDEKYGSFTTVGEDVKQFIHSRLHALLEEVVKGLPKEKEQLDKNDPDNYGACYAIAGFNDCRTKIATHLQEEIKKIV